MRKYVRHNTWHSIFSHCMLQCSLQCHIVHTCILHVFVGCCLATRGVRGLLWAMGWVWLTESWPVGLLGNSRQNSYITLIGDAFAHAAHASQLR